MKTAKECWISNGLNPDYYIDSVEAAMEEYAAHPMSAEQYTLDNGMGTATVMSAEQYSSGAIHSLGEFPATAPMSAERVDVMLRIADVQARIEENESMLEMAILHSDTRFQIVLKKRIGDLKNQLHTPSVKAEGWVSVEEFWNSLTDEQRLQLRSCKGCGSLDTSCQCWNDE